MMVLWILGYVVSAIAFYALISRVAPLQEEPVWVNTAPPRSQQVVDMFAQSHRQAAA